MCLCVLTADWPDEYMVQYVVSVLYFIRANKMITFEPFPKGSLQRGDSLWESGGGAKQKRNICSGIGVSYSLSYSFQPLAVFRLIWFPLFALTRSHKTVTRVLWVYFIVCVCVNDEIFILFIILPWDNWNQSGILTCIVMG